MGREAVVGIAHRALIYIEEPPSSLPRVPCRTVLVSSHVPTVSEEFLHQSEPFGSRLASFGRYQTPTAAVMQ